MKSEQELREHVLAKATADEGFRERLVADPRGTVEQECGVRFPDGYQLEVHQEDATTTHMVLPPSSRLSERELELVAAGHHLGW